MTKINDLLHVAIQKQIAEDLQYGTPGLDECNTCALEFTYEERQMIPQKHHNELIALCGLINNLHERADILRKGETMAFDKEFHVFIHKKVGDNIHDNWNPHSFDTQEEVKNFLLTLPRTTGVVIYNKVGVLNIKDFGETYFKIHLVFQDHRSGWLDEDGGLVVAEAATKIAESNISLWLKDIDFGKLIRMEFHPVT